MRRQTSQRAGVYITQPNRYQAFIPAELPPDPPIKINDEIQVLLSRADRELGRLDGSIQTLPNPDLFVFMYIRKEAVLSSQIEGTQSSLQDVLAAEAKLFKPHPDSDAFEVLNYIHAMNYGLVRLKDLPVSTRLIKEIHEKLLYKVRGYHLTPGELRTSQNWIGPAGSMINDAIFVPPPPHEIPQLLSNLEKIIHYDDKLPLLIKIALIHAQFETIHPFLDGNGRVGRLLISFLLYHQKVLQKPVLYLSLYFKENRQKYYDLLQDIRDHGKWEEWIIFFLKGIVSVSRQATLTIREIQNLREAHRQLLVENLGRSGSNGLKVHEALFSQPFVSVKDIRKLTQTSYPAANELIKRFESLGILIEVTGRKRNRVYLYRKYMDVLNNSRITDRAVD